jgi:SAM-dependent methyltransferase
MSTGKQVLLIDPEAAPAMPGLADALRAAGADAVGCEVDPVRAAMCEAKGHRVMRMNFLETVPTADFDQVVINPPFYGRHYAKHVRHALRFLKPGGRLTAILPATARYDHGELDDLRPHWDDLPVGSFSESGTNINATVATIRRAE